MQNSVQHLHLFTGSIDWLALSSCLQNKSKIAMEFCENRITQTMITTTLQTYSRLILRSFDSVTGPVI